jgi:hypothetical protein
MCLSLTRKAISAARPPTSRHNGQSTARDHDYDRRLPVSPCDRDPLHVADAQRDQHSKHTPDRRRDRESQQQTGCRQNARRSCPTSRTACKSPGTCGPASR